MRQASHTAMYAARSPWHSGNKPSEPLRSPECPKCGECRLIERIGAGWFCQVCATAWRTPPRSARRRL